MLADFIGENEGELTAYAGDTVLLLSTEEEVPNGWLLCSVDNGIGFLPETFVAPVAVERPPRIVLADFEAQNESELSVRQGDLVLLMKPETTETGWAEVAPVGADDIEAAAGFVPSTYISEVPPHGTFKASFQGETEGELPSAAEGDAVWRVDDGAEPVMGWIDVVLANGLRGQAPETYIEWDNAAGVGLGNDGVDGYAEAPEAAPMGYEDQGEEEEDEDEDDWVVNAKQMIHDAEGTSRVAGIALADFVDESEVRAVLPPPHLARLLAPCRALTRKA